MSVKLEEIWKIELETQRNNKQQEKVEKPWGTLEKPASVEVVVLSRGGSDRRIGPGFCWLRFHLFLWSLILAPKTRLYHTTLKLHWPSIFLCHTLPPSLERTGFWLVLYYKVSADCNCMHIRCIFAGKHLRVRLFYSPIMSSVQIWKTNKCSLYSGPCSNTNVRNATSNNWPINGLSMPLQNQLQMSILRRRRTCTYPRLRL